MKGNKQTGKTAARADNPFLFSITALDDGTQSGIIDVVGQIGYDDRQQLDFCDNLDRFVRAGVRSITMRVNSPGGFVFTAMPMYDKLESLKAQGIMIRGEVHGEAASAASLLLMGCSTVAMTPHSGLMVHQPSAILYGPVDEILAQAQMLSDTRIRMFDIYGKKCNKPGATVDADHKISVYYTPEAALAYGLIDEIMAAGDDEEKGPPDDDDLDDEPADPEDTEENENPDDEEEPTATGGIAPMTATLAHVGALSARLGLPVFGAAVKTVRTEKRRRAMASMRAEIAGLKTMLAAARAEKGMDAAAVEAMLEDRVGRAVEERLVALGVPSETLPPSVDTPGAPQSTSPKTAAALKAMSTQDLLAYAVTDPDRVRRWMETGE